MRTVHGIFAILISWPFNGCLHAGFMGVENWGSTVDQGFTIN